MPVGGMHSGTWGGYYEESGKHFPTSTAFFFFPGHAFGIGHDNVGEFRLEGTLNSSFHLTANKTYTKFNAGEATVHHPIKYEGSFERDGTIDGKWSTSEFKPYSGSFKWVPQDENPASLTPDWIAVLIDQIQKAYKGDPSVFSPGVSPFGDNLLWKNLSYDEVKVIGAKLPPSKWPTLLAIYYQTYKLAIGIADDSERNAKRHAFWQIALVNAFGAQFAKELGDAHEKGRPGTAEDNRVDELNNQVAVQYALTHHGSDPLKAANDLWNTKKLHGYSDHPKHDEL